MPPERDARASPQSPQAVPPSDPQAELDDLLFTLEICRRALPWDAHPEHYDRLKRIVGMVRWCMTRR